MEGRIETQADVFNLMRSVAEQQFADTVRSIPAQVDKDIVGGMTFMTEHGADISIVLLASGHVELAAVVDGVTVSCDITLAYRKAQETNDWGAFIKEAGKAVVSTAAGEIANKALKKEMFKMFKLVSSDLQNTIEKSSAFAVALTQMVTDKINDKGAK